MARPVLYRELASWWPLLSAPEDYAEEAAFYQRTLIAFCEGEFNSLLELGSGGGNNAIHLCGGHDVEERGLTYLEWTWDPDPKNTTLAVDYAYLMRDPEGSIRVEHDRHIEGHFPREVWIRLLSDVGFTAARVPFTHSELPGEELDVFVGTRPKN